jgi:hypothetical protein
MKEIEILISRQTDTVFSVKLTRPMVEKMLKAYDLPKDARLYFSVPTGGDYSGEDIEIDDTNPIRVVWRTSTHEDTRETR